MTGPPGPVSQTTPIHIHINSSMGALLHSNGVIEHLAIILEGIGSLHVEATLLAAPIPLIYPDHVHVVLAKQRTLQHILLTPKSQKEESLLPASRPLWWS